MDGTEVLQETGRLNRKTEDGKLQVRGYVAFFFRTQVWVRRTP